MKEIAIYVVSKSGAIQNERSLAVPATKSVVFWRSSTPWAKSLAVVTVPESEIEPLSADEELSIRRLVTL